MNSILHKTKRFFEWIMNPPKQEYDDFYEEAHYILSYRTCLFLAVSLGILSILLYFYYGPIYSILTSTGFVGVMIAFVLIRKTSKYKEFAFYFNVFGAILCQLTLYVIPDQPHISDGLWMIINILFAFMTIKKESALVIAIIHGLSFFLFFYFFYNDQITLIQHLNHKQIIATSINVLSCFSIIIFLCWQNIKTTQHAKKQLNDAKTVLQNQYNTINKQNIEKTVMLKEIHHRVKNNLQVIISLLRLQSRELENEEAISKFRDTTSRVLAMALIHEKMYQSEELSRINLEEYFSSLIDDILESYEIDFKVKKTIFCDVNHLEMKSIVPLALIFNELFSNSLKYAFNSKEQAEINLHLTQENESYFCLEYRDNGKWRIPSSNDSFGIELINMLTEQLEGTVVFSASPVTKYVFRFKNSSN